MRSLLALFNKIFLLFLVSSELFASDDTPRAFYSIPSHTIINSERAYNPISGIAPISLNENNIGLTYSNRFLMKENSSVVGFGSYKLKQVSLGLFANYFGNQAYWYSSQSFLLSKKLNDKLALGISFSHTIVNQGSEYKAIHQYTPSIGLSILPFPNWKISSVLRNISHNKKTSYGSNDFAIGISYIAKNISIHTQVEKMQNTKSQFDIMGEYNINKRIYFLLRASTGYEPISIGAEVRLSGISLLFYYSYHTYLGSSPELSMYKNW